ncbi:tRNA epoxyqueuosine(34) reductase QueG, partial [Francisella tularensis subsp. holarctica]|nr:tRNA epoxyqueuosine(34) reductase QueG [Francisella tularensis subsp. holarctica]
LVNKPLLELLAMSEKDFDKYNQCSAIRRIGYAAWIRKIAIAVGNSPFNQDNIQALELKKLEFSNNQLVLELLDCAINKHKLLS